MRNYDIEKLRQIRTFPQLVKYLRDELEWPIEADDFDDLTFDYEPNELGIDKATAAKIDYIKQLRPLDDRQPWGIFFVKFEPKRLPVVVMRRILSRLVIKKRASSQQAKQPVWNMHDLLFISNYGEEEQRQITFVHFSENELDGDLPTLKVLGWDGDDTNLRVDHVAHELHEKLRWPSEDIEMETWREQWSSAFTLRHREVITTSKDLALRLADLARLIRQKAINVLSVENDKGPFRQLMNAFREMLIHDLSEDDFADMYAQTITYGLLSARVSRPEGLVADNIADMVPITNPFLQDLMATFLKMGGRQKRQSQGGLTGIDFDELGINEVVDLLRHTRMEEVLRDFGNRNPQEDPVIHFYELFLKEYDAKKRMQRGVFYTPRPVVSYIVRSVHELLQTEFGLKDGLASTVTWGEMAQQHQDVKIPEGVKPDAPFVCILDPATGTGTFLVEVIEIIHKTLTEKWECMGLSEPQRRTKWNEYVPKHLLPRLHGYELMMAPYAIAHMKIGLILHETGYRFESEERARIYLTNALEPPPRQDVTPQFETMSPALAHEAKAVNAVKRHQRFTVVIGNPPYANYGQLNKIPFILDLLDNYKRNLDEKKINLDDDFIKFLCFAEYSIITSGLGLVGMITNNTYVDGITHRQMRNHILGSFQHVLILNLHGNLKKKEVAPNGLPDENIFDITVGVTIGLFCRTNKKHDRKIKYMDLLGERNYKTQFLFQNGLDINWTILKPIDNYFYFIPKNFSCYEEYHSGYSIGDIFIVWQNGLKTDRDDLFFDFDKDILEYRIKEFYNHQLDDEFRKKYKIFVSSSYDIEHKRLQTKFDIGNIVKCLYRPMDIRWLYYHPNLTSRPAEKVMCHMLPCENVGLITTRQTKENWSILATKYICGHKSCAAYDINTLFPIYLHDFCFKNNLKFNDNIIKKEYRPNIRKEFIEILIAKYKLFNISGIKYALSIVTEDILYYLYSVFHSPTYRTRYAEFLKIDFPRVPLASSLDLFRALASLGGELVALHLVEAPGQTGVSIQHDKNQGWKYGYSTRPPIHIEFTGPAEPMVEKVTWSGGTVWIDKAKQVGFHGVPEDVWNFYIGGYQVCNKWLKDRKGRILTEEDLVHYHRIVVALYETIRLMKEIDEVIERYGGWPGAFVTNPGE